MRATQSLVASAVALLAGGFVMAASAAPGLVVHGHAQPVHAPSNGLTTLYDQTANDSGIAIVSQNFETAFDAYDAQAADDFVVPAGHTWKVSELDITGAYFNGAGLATSETVTLYANQAGKPGKMLGKVTATGADNGTGSFTLKFSKAVSLKPGTYWIAVQVNMDFGVGGEWGWENQTTVEGNPAVWENPNGGFGTGCTTYQTENACIPDGQGDHMFILKGTSS